MICSVIEALYLKDEEPHDYLHIKQKRALLLCNTLAVQSRWSILLRHRRRGSAGVRGGSASTCPQRCGVSPAACSAHGDGKVRARD